MYYQLFYVIEKKDTEQNVLCRVFKNAVLV